MVFRFAEIWFGTSQWFWRRFGAPGAMDVRYGSDSGNDSLCPDNLQVETMMKRKKIIAVIGSRECDKTLYQMAQEVGRRIAENGALLICGGRGGVMEAACRGAKKAGGITVGILPGESRKQANRFVDIPIVTGMGIGRNVIVVRSSQAVIAIDGEHGTLSEIAYALQLGIPVIGLKTWQISEEIKIVNDAKEAVELVKNLIL